MRHYEGIADAADEARTAVLSENGLPPFVLDKLWSDTQTGSSPVNLVVHFAEAVYAAPSDEVSDECKQIATGCALLAEQYGFHGMNENSRGSKIAAVLDGHEVTDPPKPEPSMLPPRPPSEESAPPAPAGG
jgi:hypothetical protein